jgi:hypothetical protein
VEASGLALPFIDREMSDARIEQFGFIANEMLAKWRLRKQHYLLAMPFGVLNKPGLSFYTRHLPKMLEKPLVGRSVSGQDDLIPIPPGFRRRLAARYF